jgi:transcription elongation factor GreA
MSNSEAQTLIKKGRFRDAEEALLVSLEDPGAHVGDWPEVVEGMVKATRDGSAETVAWATLDAIQKRLPQREAIPHCVRILRLFSKSDEFRTRAVEMYEQAYETEGLEQLIEISGLRGGKPIRRALQTLDLCLGIKPDDYLVHKDEGPPAQVVSIESDNWNVRLRTPTGEELFDPVTLGDQYELADRSDFRVLQQFDPEGFATRLNSAPADIVHTIVKANDNRMTSDDLELMLSPRHVPSGQWSKWWTKARTALKKSPNIKLEGRNPVILTLQDEVVALEDETWAQFDIHASPKAWLDLAQKYLRECKSRGLEPKREFLLRLRDAVSTEAATLEKRRDSHTLAACLTIDLIGRFAGEEPNNTDAARIISESRSVRDAFQTLPAETYWTGALECVKKNRPDDWAEAFVELIPIAAPSRCDELAEAVRQSGKGHLLSGLVDDIMGDVVGNINGVCWFYQGPKDLAGMQIPTLTTLTTRLLGALDQIKHSATIPADLAREAQARIRTVLSAKKCQRFKDCLEQIDEGMGDALLTQVKRASGLSDAGKSDLVNSILSRFPGLWAKPQKKPWEDPQILFCTAAGYAAKDAELDELINVKMKENAIAIGKAAEHGDLSENSEYKFALEERDLLRARAAEINSQMAIAKVMHGEDVPTDHVSVGARVNFKHVASGREIKLTFLGPWESNVERNILNYQAPISQALMGLRIGESAEFDYQDLEGHIEVISIESGID